MHALTMFLLAEKHAFLAIRKKTIKKAKIFVD
jgi:hypothetical protein